ncbi:MULTISPECIES: hypothetical protein [unclassified Nocardia]
MRRPTAHALDLEVMLSIGGRERTAAEYGGGFSAAPGGRHGRVAFDCRG